MKLIPVSEHPGAAKILYDLLAERTPEQSISHRVMPTWEEHLRFVEEKLWRPNPESYCKWALIEVDGVIVGALYVTWRGEIGISIFRDHQRKGHGSAAVQMLIDDWRPGVPILANVNPANTASIRMWEKLGFKHVQNTYRRETE